MMGHLLATRVLKYPEWYIHAVEIYRCVCAPPGHLISWLTNNFQEARLHLGRLDLHICHQTLYRYCLGTHCTVIYQNGHFCRVSENYIEKDSSPHRNVQAKICRPPLKCPVSIQITSDSHFDTLQPLNNAGHLRGGQYSFFQTFLHGPLNL